MSAKVFSFETVIQETLLDAFGHVNNAAYLLLYENARWSLLNESDYGIE